MIKSIFILTVLNISFFHISLLNLIFSYIIYRLSFRGHRLVILDNGGSVYELRLPSAIRSRQLRCIFSGSNGEVYFVYFAL